MELLAMATFLAMICRHTEIPLRMILEQRFTDRNVRAYT